MYTHFFPGLGGFMTLISSLLTASRSFLRLRLSEEASMANDADFL